MKLVPRIPVAADVSRRNLSSGVRPSSGAAMCERTARSACEGRNGYLDVAAPGDGRTPFAEGKSAPTHVGGYAFSLIEILVTVGLLSFIILGLLGMFTQTQRAFRASMTQTDMLEAGRGAIGFIAREVEQITPAGTRATNFLVQIPTSTGSQFPRTFAQDRLAGEPMYQALPGAVPLRTNIIQQFFFLTRQNQDWVGTGYQVVGDSANSGVGTLYRFCATNRPKFGPINLSSNFLNTPLSNFSRIADGIVHFQIRTFDTNGWLVTTNPGWGYLQAQSRGPLLTNVTGQWRWGAIEAYYTNSAVPASVEIELGVLESRTLDRYRAIANPVAQHDYLSNHVAQVHLFRQRVPIRNVDVRAYQ